MMGAGQKVLIWVVVALACAVPIALAATSPLLAWRDPIYIVAGFAGIFALILLLLQPLLINGLLSGLSLYKSRRVHRWIGALLVVAIFIHVGGLWLTSPPDVIDALLFASPTPFSVWGVLAMWAVFASALLAIFRHKQSISLKKLAPCSYSFSSGYRYWNDRPYSFDRRRYGGVFESNFVRVDCFGVFEGCDQFKGMETVGEKVT